MRFLGIGEYCDLGAMYLRMVEAGHEVRVYVENPDYHDVYKGMLNFTHQWKEELDWVKEAGTDGIILFESASKGHLQDQLREEGFQVIGGSTFGDRLEADRSFGQQIMQEMGMYIAKTIAFTSYASAIEFLKHSRKRYVYKNNGAESLRTRNYVGQLKDSSDVAALLELYRQQSATTRIAQAPDFVLMEYIDGIEIGVGAYFNGQHFLQPACLDWEHKRFFYGDLGELTGEMGTIVTYRNTEIIFYRSLAQIETRLRKSGYCGYINLNMIANADGLWPLEFTSRFGYPGYSICAALQQESWESIFKKMLTRSSLNLLTNDGFAAGVVLTVPPFPYSYGYAELSKGTPILFEPSITEEENSRLHFSEVEQRDRQLFTSGVNGYVGTAIGSGVNIKEARKKAYALAKKVILPHIRYRTDIGQKLMETDLQQLREWGYLG
jgi:phosphoribosylamine---glycine ligase